MQIFNNTTNVTNNTNRSNSKKRSKIKAGATYVSNAVSIFIDPVTLRSKAYLDIQKEDISFPIYNPEVLQYDENLNLYRYEKI